MSVYSLSTRCSVGVIDGGVNLMGSIMVVTGIMASILFLSGLFHSVLRRLGQPSVISHILAGIVVGPTLLGRVVDLEQMGMMDPGRMLEGAIRYLRVLFMLFIGIEVDLRYLRHNLPRSLAIACGGSSLCLVFALLGGNFFYSLMHPGQYPFPPEKVRDSTALFALVLTSTASPVLIRIVTELKLTGSEIGRLAIGAAFANDMASAAALSFIMVRPMLEPDAFPNQRTRTAGLALMVVSVWLTVRLAVWAAQLLNRLRRRQRYISTYELCGVLLLVAGLAVVAESMGFGVSASTFGLLIGLAMPRQGPTVRTIVDRLSYPVHQLLMPLCFAAIGARLDFARVEQFNGWRLAEAVAFATLLSAAGKGMGTILAGRALGIAAGDAFVLGFLLNVKGYVLAIDYGDEVGVLGEMAQAVLLLSSIVNTFMAGPASAAIVRQQRRAFSYQSRCLQDLGADNELGMLVCVHGAAGVHSMLALADLSKGSVHLLHLVELVTASKYNITHQLLHIRDEYGGSEDEDEDEDEDEWGSAREIDQVAAAVVAFTSYTAELPVRQATAISSLASMEEDVRNSAEDVRASLVVVPFHKELRYDGRLVCRREERRLLNQRILQRAPCTVGILVERRRLLGEADRVQKVAALFIGGPDDREAVAYASRLAEHPLASVTVCRLVHRGRRLVVEDEEATADETFLADLHARLVLTGQVSYTETPVSAGAEMANALRSMAGIYSLIILGRSSRGAVAEVMTCDMGHTDDEFQELGPVGELLASDDFRSGCSVLVLQQHSMHKTRTRKQQQEQPPQQSTTPCPC